MDLLVIKVFVADRVLASDRSPTAYRRFKILVEKPLVPEVHCRGLETRGLLNRFKFLTTLARTINLLFRERLFFIGIRLGFFRQIKNMVEG